MLGLKIKIIYLFLIIIISNNLYSRPIINAEELSEQVCKENVKIIEVNTSYNSYLSEHINCSQYTNFYKDGWRVKSNGVEMMLPSPENISNVIKTNLRIS